MYEKCHINEVALPLWNKFTSTFHNIYILFVIYNYYQAYMLYKYNNGGEKPGQVLSVSKTCC